MRSCSAILEGWSPAKARYAFDPSGVQGGGVRDPTRYKAHRRGRRGLPDCVGTMWQRPKKILNLACNFAFKKKLVVSHADFSMERRRYADRGEARALYNELMRNISTKTQPEGGALRTILVGWISKVQHSVFDNGGTIVDLQRQIVKDLHDLQGYPGGFEFAEVVRAYYRGFMERSETLQIAALKWLCGEYKTKTEAREDLGIRQIIDGNTFYDSLKLMAAFIKKAGYTGLLVKLDEMVVSVTWAFLFPCLHCRLRNQQPFPLM